MLRSTAGHRNISASLNVFMRATREQLRPMEGKFKNGRTRGRRNGGGINSNEVLGSLRFFPLSAHRFSTRSSPLPLPREHIFSNYRQLATRQIVPKHPPVDRRQV